jgi:hypothetical protein
MMKETSTHPCIVKVNSIDWTGSEIDESFGKLLITSTIAVVQINSAPCAAISFTIRTSSHKIKLCCGRGWGWWALAGDEVETTIFEFQFFTTSCITVVQINSALTAAISLTLRAWLKSADSRACSATYILKEAKN